MTTTTTQILHTEQIAVEGYDVTLREERTQARTGWTWSAPASRPGYWVTEPRVYASRADALAALTRYLWIQRRIEGSEHGLTRAEYEARCRAAGVEERSDVELRANSYAMEHGNFFMAHYAPETTVRQVLAQVRYRTLVAETPVAVRAPRPEPTYRFTCPRCGEHRDTTLSGHCDDCEV